MAKNLSSIKTNIFIMSENNDKHEEEVKDIQENTPENNEETQENVTVEPTAEELLAEEKDR